MLLFRLQNRGDIDMVCPICKKETKVESSSGDPGRTSILYRRRKCPNGHVTYTLEIPTSESLVNEGFLFARKLKGL